MHRSIYLSIILLVVAIGLSLNGLVDSVDVAYGQPSGSSSGVDDGELEELSEGEGTTGESPSSEKTSTPAPAKSSAKRSGTLRVTQPKQAEVDPAGADLYLQQIRRIETQVNELKEEIFRSRTRLAILKESVLASGLSGTELKIVHRNEMGANFKLERILYLLDGSAIRQTVDKDGELDRQEEIEILNGPISPGNHTLQVELIYRGNGFGVFSYLQSYRFTLNDVFSFRAEEGKLLTITVAGYERSGVTLELNERPDIRFERSLIDLDEQKTPRKRGKAKSDDAP